MRIGIVPTLTASSGGLYQYNLTLLRTLHEGHNPDDQFVIFTDTSSSLPEDLQAGSPRWTIQSITPPPVQPAQLKSPLDPLRQLVGEGVHREAWRKFRRLLNRRAEPDQASANQIDPDFVWWQSAMTGWFEQCGIDFMIYPNPLTLSFEARIPFIMSIHDLQHRLQPEFPEVSADGEAEAREYLFRNAARYAEFLIADSEIGKEDILNLYGEFGITEDRVKVLPFLPSAYVGVDVSEAQKTAVREKYQLPDRYLFYPAQFWPHKNHARIVQALDLLKKKSDWLVPIVFCGSHDGSIREETFQQIKALAKDRDLENQILFLGYVPDEDLGALYAGAAALVMPTFFGPTNIPILEAWAFGCPVLTSDIRGVREQAGDAAVLVDPRSVESIAEGIHRIGTDERLSRELIVRGRKRLGLYTRQDYEQRLGEIIEQAKQRWQSKLAPK
jgi:glycosyltransferase involved in cell wall biosynthesis